MKKAFTLVELLIVVSILGILAAVVVPEFGNHIQQAKESAAKDNLRILRNAIDHYALDNNDVPPGYKDNDPSGSLRAPKFISQLTTDGHYLSEIPENPFNNASLVTMVENDADFPESPVSTDLYGWMYKPYTKEIRLNWSGTDSQGKAYFEY